MLRAGRVERAQDLTKACTGQLKIGPGKQLKGLGTKFTEEIQKGDAVWIDQGEFKGAKPHACAVE